MMLKNAAVASTTTLNSAITNITAALGGTVEAIGSIHPHQEDIMIKPVEMYK